MEALNSRIYARVAGLQRLFRFSHDKIPHYHYNQMVEYSSASEGRVADQRKSFISRKRKKPCLHGMAFRLN